MNPFQHFHLLNHHAYFLHSFKDAIFHLKDHLKDKFKINHTGNPDFYYQKFEVLGIDDSRRIKENHLSKGFVEGGKRIFVIECDGMTHEAQNSLLKIFEEPNEHTHFFLLMPSVEVLLPTLRSRLLVIEFERENEKESLIEVEKFLKLSKKDKIAFVDELAEKISEEKATKHEAQIFLSSLEAAVYKNGLEKNAKALKAILKARDYLNDRSASVKQLLEYVALSF